MSLVAAYPSEVPAIAASTCPYHLRQPDDRYDWALIRSLTDERTAGRFDFYVDSHHRPRTRDDIRELLSTP